VTGGTLIAYLHPGHVSHSFHESITSLILSTPGVSGTMSMFTAAGDLVANRNAGTARFLDETDCESLLWIDSDMGFRPDALTRLRDLDVPVAGALAFSATAVAPDGYGGQRIQVQPTIFMPGLDLAGRLAFQRWDRYDSDTVVEVGATGAAFLLIRRDVLERVRAGYGDEWWTPLRGMSEDLSFCARLGELDIPIVVHTGVGTSHHKQVWISEGDHVVRDPG
jgi:hypothetical protein